MGSGEAISADQQFNALAMGCSYELLIWSTKGSWCLMSRYSAWGWSAMSNVITWPMRSITGMSVTVTRSHLHHATMS
jgi:hypothetical protein